MYNTNILREVRYLIPQTLSERCLQGVKIFVSVPFDGVFGKASPLAFLSKLTSTRDGGIGARPAEYSRLSQDAPVPPSLLGIGSAPASLLRCQASDTDGFLAIFGLNSPVLASLYPSTARSVLPVRSKTDLSAEPMPVRVVGLGGGYA